MPLWSRRRFLAFLLTVPPALAAIRLSAWGQLPSSFADATKACDPNETLTPAVAPGPEFKPNSPARSLLREPGLAGVPLTISGDVSGIRCGAVKDAVVDFWQADAEGAYDMAGYRLRGRQTTDAHGHYSLDTIVPGAAPGRPRMIHVRVQPPKGAMLTTVLFFPDDVRNAKALGFQPLLVLKVTSTPTGKKATFDFVLDL